MWVCYLDGWAVDNYATEEEAEHWTLHYNGEHNPTYEWHKDDWEDEMKNL